MKSAFKLIIILLLITITPLLAIDPNAGTTGFSVLKMNISARAIGLGNAYTALSDDANAVFFNTAGLLQVKDKELMTSYTNYIDGTQGGSFVYILHNSAPAHIAVFTNYINYGDIDRTIADNDGNYGGTTGTFGAYDMIFGIAAAKKYNDVVDLGLNIKYLTEKLDDKSASVIAGDLSLLHQTVNPKLKVGLTIKNIGKQLSYFTDDKHKEKLPVTYVAGGCYRVNDDVKAVLDLYKPTGYDMSGRLGVEYIPSTLKKNLALRAGYRTNAKDYNVSGDASLSGMSAGVGFNWQRYNLDYAICSLGDLGMTHYLTLKYTIN